MNFLGSRLLPLMMKSALLFYLSEKKLEGYNNTFPSEQDLWSICRTHMNGCLHFK